MDSVNSFIKKFSGLTEEYKFYDGTVTLRYDPKDHVYLLVKPDGTLERQDGVTTVCHIIDKSLVLMNWACKMMGQKLIATVPNTDGSVILKYEDFERLVREAKTAHKDKLEDAGEVGSKAHAWIESYIKAVLANDQLLIEQVLTHPPEDERAKNSCSAALDWMKRHNVRWISTERKIYSRQFKYAGTMDGLCIADSCDNPNCCRQKFVDRLTVADWKTSNYLYIEYILQTAAYKQAYEEETGTKVNDIWVIRLGKEDGEFEAWHIDLELAACGWLAFQKALELVRLLAEVEQGVEWMKDDRVAARKAEKQAARERDLAIKCKSADKYKGKRKPTCNNGNPCETCLKKYAAEQEAKAQRLKKLAATKKVKKAIGTNENVLKALNFLLDKSE